MPTSNLERMLVYTLLFTLAGKNPNENRYIEMFYIWLTYLLKNGGLGPNDSIAVLIDTQTLEIIKNVPLLIHLKNTAKCNISFILFEQPATISEGMVVRYMFPSKDNGETLVYLDLDVLVVNSLQNDIPKLAPNSLCLMPEGKMRHPLYACDLTDSDEIPDMCGFSSGTFAFSHGDQTLGFFRRVINDCLEVKENPRYTIDQPFFNKWVFIIFTKRVLNLSIHLLRSDMVEQQNQHDFKDTTVLVNYAGDPGVGTSHYQKMLSVICFSYLSS